MEVFRQTVASQTLVGTYCALSNRGGLVHPKTSIEDQKELSSLLQVPLVAGKLLLLSSQFRPPRLNSLHCFVELGVWNFFRFELCRAVAVRACELLLMLRDEQKKRPAFVQAAECPASSRNYSYIRT